jgi:flagellar basal-body rod protein FlgF
MAQLYIHKLSLAFLVFLFGGLFFFCNVAYANNASYITLSNQIARKTQLDMIANNVANSNTVGFEQDNLLFRAVDVKQNARRNNSFAWAETTYRNGDPGGIKITNRPTDLAIGGEGYFKVATPRGARYTLDGSMVINNQGILVNMNGFPYLSFEGEFIEIAEDFQTIEVASNGAVFVDNEEIGTIGVFGFDTPDPIIKEGGNLYAIQGGDVLLEEFTIISGALKASNVNPTLAMAQMVEMQRSFGLTTDVMTNINETETSAINKLTK